MWTSSSASPRSSAPRAASACIARSASRSAVASSRGLDTRTAVAWLSRHGLDVRAYTADLGQPDETNVADIPPTALRHGAKGARLVDCREAMVREGVVAIQCGAFHLSCGGRKYF